MSNRTIQTHQSRSARLSRSVAYTVLALAAALPAVSLTAQTAAAQTQTGEVTGRVTDANRDVGFQGAVVRIPALDLQTTTTAGGTFRFPAVPAGEHEVTVRYVGAQPFSRTITVAGPRTDLGRLTLSPAIDDMEHLLVIGRGAQTASAINRKRSADIVKDAITADAIGQFPDQNVAESARRIPGVSVANDQGEGRFIVVRGSDPSLNAVSVNGVRVPSAESDQRQVALDVIPSELLSSIEVNKTVTPEMDADVIGGSVEIRTASAFDRDGRFLTGTVEGSYSDLRDKVSPKLSAAASDIFSLGGEDNFGVALGASWFRRDFASDNVENGEGWEEQDGIFYPGGIEQRDYTVRRERLGLAANLDWEVTDTTALYLRGLYSRFKDSEGRLANIFELDDGDIASLSPDSMLASGDFLYEKSSRSRSETQTIYSLVGGGSTDFGMVTMDYEASYSKARESEPDAIAAVFEGGFDDDVLVGYSASGIRGIPLITSTNRSAIDDPANFQLDEMSLERNLTEDREWAGRLDFTFNNIFGMPGYLKAGGKVRLRNKYNDSNVTIFEGFPGDPTLADGGLAMTPHYTLGTMGPMGGADAVRAYLLSNMNDFEIDEEGSAIDSLAEDYRLKENIFATYLMANVDLGPVTVVGGARVEHTGFDTSGYELVENEDTGSINLNRVREERNYTDILPSLNVRYEPMEEIVARAAYSHTLVRPNFEQSAPINSRAIEDGELEGSFGNPRLNPYQSRNFDASLEFYPGELAILSVAGFYKDIKDYIVTADMAGQPGRFENFDEAITSINGETATLKGFEVGYQQQLAFLGEPFNGFLLAANYTYADGKARLDLGDRDIPLPRQSKHVLNGSVGYEIPNLLSVRAAVTYRSKYLEALEDLEDAAFDVYVDDHLQWDFTAQLEVTSNIAVFAKMQNANNRPYYAYYADPAFNAQYERYGWTANLGLRATY